MPTVTSYNWWENYPADTVEVLMEITESLGIINGIVKTKIDKTRPSRGLRLSVNETQALLTAIETIRDCNNNLYDNLRYCVEKTQTSYSEVNDTKDNSNESSSIES